MSELTYSFGDAGSPTETYTLAADVDVNGDGRLDGVRLDFDGSGHHDSIAWDSDGDGKVDTILVSSHHDGVYDTAYYDPSGHGHWDAAEPIDPSAGDQAGSPGASATGSEPVLTYSFGDAHTPTETYTGEAHVDVDGDGHPDGLYLDFDGSGHQDSIAWDSDGDGKVDTILVSTHHNGVYDTAYHDPSGNGHWNEADPVNGSVTTAGVAHAGAHHTGADPVLPPPPVGDPAGDPHVPADTGTDHTWVVGSDDDPYAHLAGDHDIPTADPPGHHPIGDDTTGHDPGADHFTF